MQLQQTINKKYGLENHGIKNVGNVYWNLTTGALYEEIVRRREGLILHRGPIAVKTGHFTGRAANEKFIVKEPSSESHVWWGKVNRPIDEKKVDFLFLRLLAYIQGKDLYIQDCYAGADPKYQVPIRIITETAWHNLFARNMFIQIEDEKKLTNHVPECTILNVPHFHANPELDGTNSEAFIIVNFGKKLILIGGTSYAGEIKKSVFTILNYFLPRKEKVLPMHCSANVGGSGDVAIFFGLSGTGKTTLSADPERGLIGDDEHGWSDHGVFNFEGGCYAKVIHLSPEAEPQIYRCTRRFGTILENVGVNPDTRRVDLDDATLTENTRAAYHISAIEGAVSSGMGGHPRNIIMLTCDAFGVMPPVARLTPEQAMYHFLSGYTAKVAGTEKGMGDEPQATFSTCFGAPFMALPPGVYATMLGEKILKYKSDCWLVNTGWTGGPYGTGKRMDISHTRAILRAILNGRLKEIKTQEDPFFGLHIPESCPDVPKEVLQPKNTWKDPAAYDTKAKELAGLFHKNFKNYSENVPDEVKSAGPKFGRD
ncbi:MAG: phosphoenolpyruvate carboxykinase (ATP) [bacterium]